jgi:hypothetical protein
MLCVDVNFDLSCCELILFLFCYVMCLYHFLSHILCFDAYNTTFNCVLVTLLFISLTRINMNDYWLLSYVNDEWGIN